MKKQKVLIIGGVAGGASAAARLRRIDENAEIIMFERGDYISFANCGLPYYIGGSIKNRANLLVQTPEAMRRRFAIDVRTNSEVIRINREEKTVTVSNQGQFYAESYDKLIIATGSSPITNAFPIESRENVFTVWNIPDTDRITEYLRSNSVKNAVVIGGGFVGLEMAENLRDLEIDVTLVEMAPQVMNSLDQDMAQYVHMELNKNDVALKLNTGVSKITSEGKKAIVALNNGEQLPADMVILAAGIKPNSELAAAAGLELGPKGHIAVNRCMQTTDENIFAVGDVIEVFDFITGQKTAVPLAGPANKQGRMIADNALGKSLPYSGTQGTSVAKIFTKTVSSTGLNEKKLQVLGKKLHEDYEVMIGHSNNHASYYPGATPLHIKLIYELPSGKILGAQAVGEEGTEKRIDVIATCIRYNGNARDLTSLELAYAPPFNTAKDPVNFLGYMAENAFEDLVEPIQWHEIAGLDPEKYQLVDTRTKREFEAGTIEGAELIPLDETRELLDKFDKNRTIVVFCRAGLRSYIAARILMQNGFKVKSMVGGWLTYEAGVYQPK